MISVSDFRYTNYCDESDRNSEDSELVVIRDAKEDHRYCSMDLIKNCVRRASSGSTKSEPDEAYEFETVYEEELDMSIVQDDIVEEFMIVSDDEDKESLFDSGFGSLRSFKAKTPKSNSQNKKKASSNRKSSKARKFSSSIRYQIDKSKFLGKKKARKSKANRSKQKAGNKRSNARSKSNRICTSISNRNKISNFIYFYANKPANVSNNSKYYTRSKKSNPTSQRLSESKNKKKARSKRERKFSARSQDASEEDEVKRAAGSLLRLAGVMKVEC